ncbi:Heme A synthase [Corynebacterium endometrii]|uniref:Heme A synthase n=2 Tax=Corynebacterium endometrii TaxID=2488819 RepID=A0A4V1CEL0_9CORY|nr:Heme A synthase [Corynebacterium endometrii]
MRYVSFAINPRYQLVKAIHIHYSIDKEGKVRSVTTTTTPSTNFKAPLTQREGFANRVKAFFKEASPTIAQQRMVALLLLICQGGITVTGSIVRVTGSGLGCVTWPNCHPGSLVPVAGAEPVLHQAIEFGNRLLTFVVTAAAVAAVVAVYQAKRRKELKVYAWLSVAGIVVQAVIGGISVHMELVWWMVAAHFLPSMVLVWIAGMLYTRILQHDDGTLTAMYPSVVRSLAIVAAVALSVVLITGTMVTGSGPHAGDAEASLQGRLDVDTEMMAIIHAICMYVYLAFTAITVFLLHRYNAVKTAKKIGWILIVVILVQWAIGVTQFHLGVPRWTIPAHIAMSSVVTAMTSILWANGIHRKDGTSPTTGSPQGDLKYEARQAALALRKGR